MSTTPNDITNDETDPRQEAAQRLAWVGMLQMHQLKRAMRLGRGAPWQDPSQGQGRVLAILKLQPELTQKELTFLTGMSRQSLAELLAKLERQGLVEREPSPDDRRVVVVRLTEAGRAAEQAADHTPSDELLDALEDDEVTQLSGYLARILEHAEHELADELGARRQAFEEFWRARGEFGPGPRGGFGRGGFPGFGPWPGGPGPRGPWGPRHGGPHGPHHGGPHGPHRGPSAEGDAGDQAV